MMMSERGSRERGHVSHVSKPKYADRSRTLHRPRCSARLSVIAASLRAAAREWTPPALWFDLAPPKAFYVPGQG